MPKRTLTRGVGGHKAGSTIDVDPVAARMLDAAGVTKQPVEGDRSHGEVDSYEGNVRVDTDGGPGPDDADHPSNSRGRGLDGQGDTAEPAATFDPAEHNVAEVQAYLETAADDERARVLDLEAKGKARSSLLG